MSKAQSGEAHLGDFDSAFLKKKMSLNCKWIHKLKPCERRKHKKKTEVIIELVLVSQKLQKKQSEEKV